MSNPRVPESQRAYPLKSEWIAATTIREKLLHDSHINFSIYRHMKNHEWHHWNKCYSTEDNRILPNGYYFHFNTYSLSREDHAINHHDMVLSCFINNTDNGEMKIKESLDPRLSIVVSENDECVFGCVSRKRNELFLYYPRDNGYDERHYCIPGLDIPPVKIKKQVLTTWSDPESKEVHTGFSIFKTKEKEEIVSITSMPRCEEATIAMALNTGDIIVGKVVDNKFHNYAISKPIFSSQDITLIANEKGILIAYDPKQNKIFFWDLQKSRNYTAIDCPNIFNLNISISGQYLTALEDQRHGCLSSTIHCYELPTFKHRIIKLDEPVVDIAIGPGNEAFILKKGQEYLSDTNYVYPGTIESLFPENKKTVEKPKSLSKTIARFFHAEQKPPKDNKEEVVILRQLGR